MVLLPVAVLLLPLILVVLNVSFIKTAVLLLSVSPGYAVTAGHFSSPNVIDVAAGAPQHNGVGKVGTSSFGLLPVVESSSV